jgi:hypothetical protein
LSKGAAYWVPYKERQINVLDRVKGGGEDKFANRRNDLGRGASVLSVNCILLEHIFTVLIIGNFNSD